MKFKISFVNYGKTQANVKPCAAAVVKDRGEFADYDNWEVEINSLEELMNLITEVKSDLIIDRDSIVIHDDYME